MWLSGIVFYSLVIPLARFSLSLSLSLSPHTYSNQDAALVGLCVRSSLIQSMIQLVSHLQLPNSWWWFYRIDFSTFDILEDEEVRQGLKKFSNWPTYPQLYVSGELIGGLDIIRVCAKTTKVVLIIIILLCYLTYRSWRNRMSCSQHLVWTNNEL